MTDILDPNDPMPAARVFPITEVAERLAISISSATLLLKAGDIGHIKIGSRKFVPAAELVRYIDTRITAARAAGTFPAA